MFPLNEPFEIAVISESEIIPRSEFVSFACNSSGGDTGVGGC